MEEEKEPPKGICNPVLRMDKDGGYRLALHLRQMGIGKLSEGVKRCCRTRQEETAKFADEREQRRARMVTTGAGAAERPLARWVPLVLSRSSK